MVGLDIKKVLDDVFTEKNLLMLAGFVVLSIVVFFALPHLRDVFKFAGEYTDALAVLTIGIIATIVLVFFARDIAEKLNIGAIAVIVCGFMVVQTILDELVGFKIITTRKVEAK